MVSMLDSLAVYREFEPQSGHIKYNKSDVHCLSAKYVKADPIISLETNLLSPWYSWKIAELGLGNSYSLKDVPLRKGPYNNH
jgi:hypothetical protein